MDLERYCACIARWAATDGFAPDGSGGEGEGSGDEEPAAHAGDGDGGAFGALPAELRSGLEAVSDRGEAVAGGSASGDAVTVQPAALQGGGQSAAAGQGGANHGAAAAPQHAAARRTRAPVVVALTLTMDAAEHAQAVEGWLRRSPECAGPRECTVPRAGSGLRTAGSGSASGSGNWLQASSLRGQPEHSSRGAPQGTAGRAAEGAAEGAAAGAAMSPAIGGAMSATEEQRSAAWGKAAQTAAAGGCWERADVDGSGGCCAGHDRGRPAGEDAGARGARGSGTEQASSGGGCRESGCRAGAARCERLAQPSAGLGAEPDCACSGPTDAAAGVGEAPGDASRGDGWRADAGRAIPGEEGAGRGDAWRDAGRVAIESGETSSGSLRLRETAARNMRVIDAHLRAQCAPGEAPLIVQAGCLKPAEALSLL